LENVSYYKSSSRAFLTLQRTSLEKNSAPREVHYKSSYSNGGKTWELTFASELGKLGAGKAAIGDGLLDAVTVSKSSGQTKLTIEASQPVVVILYTKSQYDFGILETTISVIPKPDPSKPLVVIDAGHGGHDPGAVAPNGKKEKAYTLDIALRLKRSLEQLGITVFLTRDDDFYPELYERARLANELRADLYVSIHVNAADKNPAAKGTETLFYPSKGAYGQLTERLFAEITQKNLIKKLNTVNRGIVERPNLVVLNSTKMPSVLVEAAFVSNAGDLAELERTSFRKRVADAVAVSTSQALALLE
jgi:N-acetylmuramoyl-L-alanine amidase